MTRKKQPKDEPWEWALKIIHADNGFILDGEWELIKGKVLIQGKESMEERKDEAFLMKKLLWEVMEYFGFYNSKHHKYNIDVRVIKNKEAIE